MDSQLFQLDRPDIHRHVALLSGFLEHAKADDSIRAVVIGGSFARGNADNWSDLDLYPLVHELPPAEEAEILVEEWARTMGAYVASFTRGMLTGFGLGFTFIYPPLVFVDINLNDSSSLSSNQMWAKRRVLLDKDGFFSSFLVGQAELWTDKLIQDSLVLYEKSIQTQFWVQYWKAYVCIQRCRLWEAISYIQRMREFLFFRLRLFHHIPTMNPQRPYKGIDVQLTDEETLEELKQTLPTFSTQSILTALASCVAAYDRYTTEDELDTIDLRNVILKSMPIEGGAGGTI